MSNVFDEREKAFEAKYRLDEELAFKVTTRRDKMFGLWAAGQMGLEGAEAEAYARSVVEEELSPHHDVLHKVSRDLAARNITLPDIKLQGELDRLAIIARDQVMAEYQPPEQE